MNRLSIVRARANIAAVTAALAILSLAPGVPSAAAASIQSGPVAPTTLDSAPIAGGQVNSIIMRDGGVCDPIRHMGC